jgi:murein L,D-transpeptidase YcbB/YkuD
MCLAGSLVLLAPPALAASPAVVTTAVATVARGEESARPSWFADSEGRAAIALVELLQSSELDGLSAKKFNPSALRRAVRKAQGGNPSDIARASMMLDRALVAYVGALRSNNSPEWIINDRDAVPGAPSASSLLAKAAAASSLERWVADMGFMHESYAGLRRALAGAAERGDSRADALLRINLQRARLLPSDGRFVLVNAAAQRLYAYEDGKVVDWMRVVVGKPAMPTPMMAAMIRYTAANPYWNVPPDLAAERIAPNVLKEGPAYLRRLGYVVLSDWTDDAKPVDPTTIDWQAVADGKVQIRVRQEPGPHNSMGRMKFMFPNAQGVYLHDTPDKQLLNEAAAAFASRVEADGAPGTASRSLMIHSGLLFDRSAPT